jgi:hypothetical protein
MDITVLDHFLLQVDDVEFMKVWMKTVYFQF